MQLKDEKVKESNAKVDQYLHELKDLRRKNDELDINL
jgi:hypothetical protein